MHCAHDGQLVASSRQTVQHGNTLMPPGQRQQDKGAEVIASILDGHVSLSERETAVLATHLHTCSAQRAGPSELTATLQAVSVLVQERQTAAIAGSGLPFWLLNLAEDLVLAACGEREEGDMLKEVMDLVVQACSVLLVSASTGIASLTLHMLSPAMWTLQVERSGGQRTLWPWLTESACCFPVLHILLGLNSLLRLVIPPPFSPDLSPSLPQLVHVLSSMLVTGAEWEAGDHLVLLRCVRDSLDVGVVAFLLDHLQFSSLPLLVG